jgi:hypothetical protein
VNRDQEGIEESAHASEQRLADDLIDVEIDNNGSLDRLRDLVCSLMDLRVYA